MSVLPSEILDQRLAVLRTLLGPGWLGPAWIDSRSAGLTGQDWASMERCYGRLVSWLLPGLRHLCQPGGGGGVRTVVGTSSDPALSVPDVPVALMHALRGGMTASPSGIDTFCRVTAGDLLGGIVPFLAWMYCLHEKRRGLVLDARESDQVPLARCIVLLAAVPGAGKSVVASLVEQFASLLKGYPRVQSIGMDGWHLPNQVIQSRTFTDESGRVVPLVGRKGSPESFDVKALANEVRSLAWDPEPAKLPVYDRRRHEPVAGAVTVAAPIVLLEGNYLLMQAQGWEGVAGIACGSAWLDVPIALARQSIVARHMAGGRTRQEAEAKWRGQRSA